jgi:DNA modification methylase
MGDSYNAGTNAPQKPSTGSDVGNWNKAGSIGNVRCKVEGLKTKDLVGIPWMLAFALRADGWYLRQDIIWAKPNPMPESVTDRCTKSHEYIFLLSKSARYYYNAAAIAELSLTDDERRPYGNLGAWELDGRPAEQRHGGEARGRGGVNAFRGQGSNREEGSGQANRSGRDMRDVGIGATRNKRDVWTVTTKPYKEAHFATFPPDLIEPCILAGCRPMGKRCDCDVEIGSPLASGDVNDPSLLTGRAGMNRPRRDGEGKRIVTRWEQRHWAHEIESSDHYEAMCREAGSAMEHWTRVDPSGARPPAPEFLQSWLERGWLTEASPCDHPIEPAGIVLDPFMGSGTTAQVAISKGRHYIGIEINPKYCKLAEKRVAKTPVPLFVEA